MKNTMNKSYTGMHSEFNAILAKADKEGGCRRSDTQEFAFWLPHRWMQSNVINYQEIADAIKKSDFRGRWLFSDEVRIVDDESNILQNYDDSNTSYYESGILRRLRNEHNHVSISLDKNKQLKAESTILDRDGEVKTFDLTNIVSVEYTENPDFKVDYNHVIEHCKYGLELKTEDEKTVFIMSPGVWAGIP